MTEQLPVICLMGPTATGKTQLAIEIAQHFPCRIINVDSAMIYRNMNIGTAKPSLALRQRFPHYLLDLCEPEEYYSVATFCRDAKKEIEQSFACQHYPLLVGGTMMYFHALQSGLANIPKCDLKLRQQLLEEGQQLGWPALHDRLQKIDPKSAQRINCNDPQRIVRALEVYLQTNRPLSDFHEQQSVDSASVAKSYKFINIGLAPEDRSQLHKKIETRFATMLQEGFVDEVKLLRERKTLNLENTSMRCIGYRQIWRYLEGDYDFDTMCQKAIIATRQLAKRQLTWLRRWPELNAIEVKANQDVSWENIKQIIIR